MLRDKMAALQYLDQVDANLDRLERYIEEHPEALPEKKGDLIIPRRLVDKGTKMTVKIISYGKNNAAFLVTKNCFAANAVTQSVVLNLEKVEEVYCQELTLEFDEPGNTKLELWVDGERIVRQIAVMDKGYMMLIPWVGHNEPYMDEEIHRFDISGDYWMNRPQAEAEPEKVIKKWHSFVKNYHKYGDRAACFANGRSIIPKAETDCLFELDYEVQERGLRQLVRQMRLLGYDNMELFASYTPDAATLEILEKLGVKGLTSLCAWQNQQDGDWKINHCGVANQPYYPAPDDFRRAGEKRDIMCFTMGNSSCNRNYSIMALDSCPTNIVPSERYFENRVLHHNMQRFYDVFDGYINDSKNNESPLIITIALEAFRCLMDWNAANDLAVRYIVKKAETEKIVFTSAADVFDYHKDHNLDMQEAYFCQPDYYYGYHSAELPGRVEDRMEADTKEYLAVIKRSSSLPMYFYDYTKEWQNPRYEEVNRSEYGNVNPDTHKPSECYPKQVYTEDMSVDIQIRGEQILILIDSETAKERMVTGVFDVPFEADFMANADKKDVRLKKITDCWTGNTHLFVDLGSVDAGHTEVAITVQGIPRTPISAECIKDTFGVMWYGDHAYMRSMDRDAAIKVRLKAPDSAYVLLHSGEKILPEEGVLEFAVNESGLNEAPMLWGYERKAFEQALKEAEVEITGPTKCRRWWYDREKKRRELEAQKKG